MLEGISRLISWLGQPARWPTRCTTSCFSVLSSFLYPHYKSSHYPWNWKENFREKTLEMHLKVRDCTPTIIYTFLLVFLYSYLSNYISLRVLNPNTYITQFECCELFWCLWEALDETILWWMQLELIARFRKLVKTRLSEAHW